MAGVPHDAPSHCRLRGDRAPYRTLFSVSCADPLENDYWEALERYNTLRPAPVDLEPALRAEADKLRAELDAIDQASEDDEPSEEAEHRRSRKIRQRHPLAPRAPSQVIDPKMPGSSGNPAFPFPASSIACIILTKVAKSLERNLGGFHHRGGLPCSFGTYPIIRPKTRPLADACPEFSVSLSSADDPSGEICQARWKNESGPYSRAALLLNGIGTGAS
jgi:hypothetical protein